MSQTSSSAFAQTLADLKSQGVHVLTAEGQPFALPEDRQQILALLSNGYLCVAVGQEKSLGVMTFRSRLKKESFPLKKTYPLQMAQIRALYQELGQIGPVGRSAYSGVRDSGGALSAAQADIIQMISEGVHREASDIHLADLGEHAEVLFRIHGDLYKVQERTAESMREMCAALFHTMCDISDNTYKPGVHQDARMKEDMARRCGLLGSRIASGPTARGSRMVIRLLYDTGKKVQSLAGLGYLPEQLDQFDFMRRQRAGINILSGATGSGKSTTLVSALHDIIERAKEEGNEQMLRHGEEFVGVSVVTVEDPPEYKIVGAHQTPLLADKQDEESIRQGWQNSIKAAMRQDPDYLMIGEVRDPGSAKAAFDAATTGHGVWTTVHVTDAVSIMTRLRGLNVEVDRMLDPEIVTGLVNQTLVQKLCPHCSIPWTQFRGPLDPALRARVEGYCDLEYVRLRGQGCSHCGGKGIVGRVVIAEIINPNLAFMEAFSSQNKAKAKDYWVREMGGITKCMALIRRINEGMVDPREGEINVCALDRERLTMGLDYSLVGDFAAGRDRVRARDIWWQGPLASAPTIATRPDVDGELNGFESGAVASTPVRLRAVAGGAGAAR